MNMREQFLRVSYNHLIKKLNICNIPLSESEEYDIWWILSMYSLLRVSLYLKMKDPLYIQVVLEKDKLRLELNLENTGNKEIIFTTALHTYFRYKVSH